MPDRTKRFLYNFGQSFPQRKKIHAVKDAHFENPQSERSVLEVYGKRTSTSTACHLETVETLYIRISSLVRERDFYYLNNKKLQEN